MLVLAQGSPFNDPAVAGFFIVFVIIMLAITAITLIGMWKTYEKAGQPGWSVLIPFYNIYIMCKIAERPSWWLILLLIPYVNFVVMIIVSLDIARRFGKSDLFGVGLALLGPIFWCILAFSDARYTPQNSLSDS